jgi:predicted flap endonuclease-1-like 5' DNA nuclease
MEKPRDHLVLPIAALVFGLVLGAAIGLVVLGWWLWPVQWTNASPAYLSYNEKVDYLRLGIAAYGYDRNVDMAKEHYAALGTDADKALAEIVKNPQGLSPDLMIDFTAQVTGTTPEAVVVKPPQPQTKQNLLPTILGLIFALILLSIVGVVIYLVFRGRRKEKLSEMPQSEQSLVEEIYPAETTEPAYVNPPLERQVQEETEAPLAPEDSYITRPLADNELPVVLPEPTIPTIGTVSKEETLPQADFVPAFVMPEQPETSIIEEAPESGVEELPVTATTPEKALVEELPTPSMGDLVTIPPVQPESEITSKTPPIIIEESGTPVSESPIEEIQVSSEPEPSSSDISVPLPVESWDQKMAKKVIFLEGIGEAYARRLETIGVSTTGILFKVGATPKGRKEISVRSGISETLILKWVNQIDLFRIKGVGAEYAELLEAAGVDTVLELAQRNPDHLLSKLTEVNEDRKLVRKLPVFSQIAEWIANAQRLPRVIQY